jgi:uncharacterized damage-inducible protein DinB
VKDSIAEAFLEQAQTHLTVDFLPKLRACVELLESEQLWWRPNPASNSIGNLLMHLEGNVRQWILTGVDGQADVRNRPEEFSSRQGESGSALLRRLERTVHEAVAAMRRLRRDDLLEVKTIQGYRVTCLQAVFHVVEHFSYHTGQIVFVAKQLTGRDLRFYDLD